MDSKFCYFNSETPIRLYSLIQFYKKKANTNLQKWGDISINKRFIIQSLNPAGTLKIEGPKRY